MRMYDIITKKKQGLELTEEEIAFFVRGYTSGEIPDYQVSALLMAVCLRGMSDSETEALTAAITDSGDVIDLECFGTLSVDKHSTGGVGDKTTLIIAPIAAALGCKVAKMSGRGLGHTGGTVDKLESIPGFRTALSSEEFFGQVKDIGIAVVAQSGNLAPADKRLYALRDVTATVDSIPLITASVMGKKLASGTHNIVLDVKYGSGSFMKTKEDAESLAKSMVRIGKRRGKSISALITDMDTPLGLAVGNALEVAEAIETLRGKGPRDLTEICFELAAEMVRLAKKTDRDKALAEVKACVASGSALLKLREWISAQGGNPAVTDDPELLPHAKYIKALKATEQGYISHMNAEEIGICAALLGAGRRTKDEEIDPAAGIVLSKKTGDRVERGETFATLYTNKKELLPEAEALLTEAVEISDISPKKLPIIAKIIT